jgi:hypothetical protein
MADYKLELVVQVDVGKANASIRSVTVCLVQHGADGRKGCAGSLVGSRRA